MIWKSRNKEVFQGEQTTELEIINTSRAMVKEIKWTTEHFIVKGSSNIPGIQRKAWLPPREWISVFSYICIIFLYKIGDSISTKGVK